MSKLPQGNAASEKDPAQLLNYTFREINGVYTASSRIACPNDKVFNLENIIPIGPQNARVMPNISAPLFDFTSDFIYYAEDVNLNGQEFIVCFASNGGVHLFNVLNNTDVVINISNFLSGANSRVTQWKNTVLLFIDSTGYYSYDGTNFQQITGPGVPSAGDDIAVYQGRVWIAQGRLLVNSGANDYTAPAFLATNGAAFNALTDPSIRSKVRRMTVSNGVMYLVGDTNVNGIYNVQVSSGAVPPTPTYQNDNVQALIGTDQPASVFAYTSGMFMLANRYGIYSVYGVQAPKMSDDINGTWKYIDFTKPISGGPVVINGILCAAFLVNRLNDPIFGSNTIVAMFTQRAAPSEIQTGEAVWFFANYGNLTFIVPAIKNGVQCMYGFIGNKIFQLFADEATAPTAKVMTKLWQMEDDLAVKEVLTVGFAAVIRILGSSINLSVDSSTASYDAGVTVGLQNGSWVNAAGVQGQWINAANQTGGWFTPGPSLVFGTAPAVGDRNIGLTLTSVGYGYELNLMAMDYKLRQRWAVG